MSHFKDRKLTRKKLVLVPRAAHQHTMEEVVGLPEELDALQPIRFSFTATAVITVQHNTGHYYSVSAFDSSDEQMIGALTCNDGMKVVYEFASPESGFLLLTR